jgi:hypothetical protein
MGADINGNPIASQVIRKFDNGHSTEGWLRISGQRHGAGRGNSFFALICTPEHLVWTTKNDYVEARTLADGIVFYLWTDPSLSPLQGLSYWVNSGDGCLQIMKKYCISGGDISG